MSETPPVNQWIPVLMGLIAVLLAIIPAAVTIVATLKGVKNEVTKISDQVTVTDQKIDITSARVDGKLTELMAALEIVNIQKGVDKEKARAATEAVTDAATSKAREEGIEQGVRETELSQVVVNKAAQILAGPIPVKIENEVTPVTIVEKEENK